MQSGADLSNGPSTNVELPPELADALADIVTLIVLLACAAAVGASLCASCAFDFCRGCCWELPTALVVSAVRLLTWPCCGRVEGAEIPLGATRP